MHFQLETQAREAISKRSNLIGNSEFIHGFRCAGPVWTDATNTMAHAYREFWKTGVAGGNLADVNGLGKHGKGYVNPMFAVSSAPAGDYAVHYGTEPLLGFHLAHTFHEQIVSGFKDVVQKTKGAVEAAKAQFMDWCCCFKKYIDNGRIVVSLFEGDAAALCHELQLKTVVKGEKKPSTYIKPWSSRLLLVDGNRRIDFFDVIDTSNLSDHVGLINMITATGPLLRQDNAFATLYIETLLVASENIHEMLSTVIGLDIVTFSLLVGIVPVGLLSGVTLEAVGNEMALFARSSGKTDRTQCRLRIPWKRLESVAQPPALGAPQAHFEAEALASCLLTIYQKMFEHENLARLMERMQRLATKTPYSTDMERYTRAAVVALLRLCRTRVATNWEETLRLFLEKVQNDNSLIIGSNSLQELFMHLHWFGIWTTDALRKGPRQLGAITGLTLRSKSHDKGLLAEDTLPAVVHVNFVVPRKALSIFTSRNADEIGSPALHVAVCQSVSSCAYENIFSFFHCCFGRLVTENGKELAMIEDELGWMGSANMLISCPVPAFGLLIGPKDGIRISLMIKTSPETVQTFQKQVGARLQVFETRLNENVYICRDAPKLSCENSISLQHRWIQVNSDDRGKKFSQSTVRTKPNFTISHLNQHIDFPVGSPTSRSLASGSVVKLTESSPNTVALQIGDSIARTVNFPFQVDGSKSKLKVARKSSWVEVEVPIHTAPSLDKFDSWTQILLSREGPPMLWSIPKVNLDIQPEIHFPPREEVSWIQTFLATAVSDIEQPMQHSAARHSTSATTASPKYDFKQSLNTIFGSFAGIHYQCPSGLKVFQLTVERSCHTIIFAKALRHDLDLGSIVLDAYVVPLKIEMVYELMDALATLQEKHSLGIVLSRQESIVWKRVLPALAERCRTWSHKSTCEYLKEGVPRSTADENPSLCSCGQGKVPEDFAKENKEWKPFAQYATRIALAPIFPVPYVEPSMSDLREMISSSNKEMSGSKPSKPRCDACGKTDVLLKACARCGKARYCNHACQKAAWKTHKRDCKAI